MRSSCLTARRHTACRAVCRRAVRHHERVRQQTVMYPFLSALAQALASVHACMCTAGSYGPAEGAERCALVMRDGAWPRRAPSFAMNKPPPPPPDVSARDAGRSCMFAERRDITKQRPGVSCVLYCATLMQKRALESSRDSQSVLDQHPWQELLLQRL